jgi:hypothetical protein
MRGTGKIYTIPGLPVSSPDHSRLAYAACSPADGLPDEREAEIGIVRIVDNRPVMEALARMPCNAGDCKIDWEDDSTVSAVCEDSYDNSRTPWTMLLTRRDYGWASRASNR